MKYLHVCGYIARASGRSNDIVTLTPGALYVTAKAFVSVMRFRMIKAIG